MSLFPKDQVRIGVSDAIEIARAKRQLDELAVLTTDQLTTLQRLNIGAVDEGKRCAIRASLVRALEIFDTKAAALAQEPQTTTPAA